MASQQQPAASDGFSWQFAGMSKYQLYDLMSKMKALIEMNQQQSRKVLVENPRLTRGLFQAQIMLGMIQPPQEIPNVQQASAKPHPVQVAQQPNVQICQTLSAQAGVASSSQHSVPVRPVQVQPSISMSSPSVPPLNFLSQTMTLNLPPPPPQTKGFLNTQGSAISLTQSTPTHNLPLPLPPPHYPIQSQMPMSSGLTQQPLQATGVMHQLQQPPLPQQQRPASLQLFPQHVHSQMHHNLGYQPSSVPPQLLPHSMFHLGNNFPSFAQGPPPLPSQPPHQQLYQGGPHIGADYGNHVGSSAQMDRGASWAPGMPEKSMPIPQLPGPPRLASGQMPPGIGGHPPQPPPLTPDMEKALLQQVMSLTPEQISLLPPEQRNQVKQLQEMLVRR